MKTRPLIYAIAMAFSGLVACQEEIRPEDLSFTKVYGLDGESTGKDILETSDGGFVIVGGYSKTTSLPNDEPAIAPFILRTDARGNQINFRPFYFTNEFVDSSYVNYLEQSWGLDGEVSPNVQVDFPFANLQFTFDQVVQLQNGNFFVLGGVPAIFDDGTQDGIIDGLFFYVIFDADFDLLRFEFLNNSEEELKGGIWRGYQIRDPKPLLMGNGDILVLRGGAFQNYFSRYPGYSIYRFRDNGDMVSINSFDGVLSGSNVFPDSWTLDESENPVICGTYVDPIPRSEEDLIRDNDIYIHRINLTTLTRDTLVFGEGNYNYSFRGGIIRTDNGFVLGDYHANEVGEANQDDDGDGFRNIYGGLWFFDHDFNFIRKTEITELEVEQQIARIISTADGGIAAAYWRKTPEKNDVLVVKSDENGNVLWRRVLTVGFDGIEGNTDLPISRIIPTMDGGLAILGNMQFNGMGNRLNLVKLDANGNL